jgi:hypothetical protein
MEQITSSKDQGCTFYFVDQQEVFIHALEDPFVSLLTSTKTMNVAVFINHGCQIHLNSKWSIFIFFFLFEESERRKQSNSHFIFWLH